jgi:hypothetical protein
MIYWKYRVKIPEKSKVVAVWLSRLSGRSFATPEKRLRSG